MLADFGEASCSILLTSLAKESGGRKLTYIMIMAIHDLPVVYDHCTVKQTYENVLNTHY